MLGAALQPQKGSDRTRQLLVTEARPPRPAAAPQDVRLRCHALGLPGLVHLSRLRVWSRSLERKMGEEDRAWLREHWALEDPPEGGYASDTQTLYRLWLQ